MHCFAKNALTFFWRLSLWLLTFNKLTVCYGITIMSVQMGPECWVCENYVSFTWYCYNWANQCKEKQLLSAAIIPWKTLKSKQWHLLTSQFVSNIFFKTLTLTTPAGGRTFMIHNTKCSLCLEDSASGEVLLRTCDLDSLLQQWVWLDQGMLMCIASSRCLSAQQTEAVRTQMCQGPGVEAAELTWDCDMDQLVSRNTSMLLSADGHRPILSHISKYSKWRSLDKGDICQDQLSKSMTGWLFVKTCWSSVACYMYCR